MKLFLIIIVLMFFGLMSNAQSIFGFNGGINKSSYFDNSHSPHYVGNYKSPLTYTFTACLKQRNHKFLNSGFEISFVNKSLDLNASYGGNGSSITRNTHFNLNYLYFSIFPELSLGNKIVFNISAGPSLGFLVSSNKKGNSSSYFGAGVNNSSEENGNANSDFKRSVIRLFAKCGLEIPVNDRLKISLENSYNFGILNSATGEIASYCSLKSNDFSTTIGIIYKLKNLTFRFLPKPKDHSKKNL